MELFKIQLLLFISSVCRAGKELKGSGSEFHARVDLINLKYVSFSNSEEDNLERGIRNAKKSSKSMCQTLGIWKKAIWELK